MKTYKHIQIVDYTKMKSPTQHIKKKEKLGRWKGKVWNITEDEVEVKEETNLVK